MLCTETNVRNSSREQLSICQRYGPPLPTSLSALHPSAHLTSTCSHSTFVVLSIGLPSYLERFSSLSTSHRPITGQKRSGRGDTEQKTKVLLLLPPLKRGARSLLFSFVCLQHSPPPTSAACVLWCLQLLEISSRKRTEKGRATRSVF